MRYALHRNAVEFLLLEMLIKRKNIGNILKPHG